MSMNTQQAEHHEPLDGKTFIHKDNAAQFVIDFAKSVKLLIDSIEIADGKNGSNLFMLHMYAPTYGKYARFGVSVPSDETEPHFSREVLKKGVLRLKHEIEESKKHVIIKMPKPIL